MNKRYVSISLRLTFWFGAIFFLGWVVFGAVMWLHLKDNLTHERRLTLVRRADRLEALLHNDPTESDADRIQDLHDFAHATGNGLAEVFHPNGARVYPSPSEAASNFPWPAIAPNEPETFLHTTTKDQLYSVLIHPTQFNGATVYLALAAPDAGNLLILNDFRRSLLASIPILLLISSAGGYWMSRRALRPVDRITATARSISITNLSGRLPVHHSGDELQRLTETCNDMLGRLESAVNAIKQFTADASHELRGPLSFTRLAAEVALRNPNLDEPSRQAFQDIVDEAARAAVLLEQMLTLARADAASFEGSLLPIDLAAIAEEISTQARLVASGKQISIQTDLRTPGLIAGDPASLRRLLWILLDNAIKYTPPSGRIEVSLRAEANRSILTVADNGMGISPTDLPHLFNRFYRADPSRSHVEGNGLGLSIAQWITGIHRAEISISSEPGQGATVIVVFPILQSEIGSSANPILFAQSRSLFSHTVG